jgi:hypothetical protein
MSVHTTGSGAVSSPLVLEGSAGANPILRWSIPAGTSWDMFVDDANSDRLSIKSGASTWFYWHTDEVVTAGTAGYIFNGSFRDRLVTSFNDASGRAAMWRNDNGSASGSVIIRAGSQSGTADLCAYGSGSGLTVAGIAMASGSALTQITGTGPMAIGTVTNATVPLITNNVLRATLNNTGLLMASRIRTAKGADVASGTTITIGADGNAVAITGTTTINHLTTTDWQAGSVVRLLFGTSLTVTHNAGSPPANTAPILLSGAANFSATANDVLTLIFDGTNWRECARTVI